MPAPDLNLLIALDVLLDEGSVVGAARRLHLSPPAMSRTLARIREAVGDPILVRAGRGLVPTPRALELRAQVHEVVAQATGLFHAGEPDVRSLKRSFNLRANDVFVVAFGALLFERVHQQAPDVVLRFVPETEGDDDALREGRIDLVIGASRTSAPQTCSQDIFSNRFLGAARHDHPLFSAAITPERFAGFEHISVSRRGLAHGPIDRELQALGLSRRVVMITPSFYPAAFALLDSDLIMPLPEPVLWTCGTLGLPLRAFEIPLPLEPVRVHQTWHLRADNDPVHRWLRQLIHDTCLESPVVRSLLGEPAD